MYQYYQLLLVYYNLIKVHGDFLVHLTLLDFLTLSYFYLNQANISLIVHLFLLYQLSNFIAGIANLDLQHFISFAHFLENFASSLAILVWRVKVALEQMKGYFLLHLTLLNLPHFLLQARAHKLAFYCLNFSLFQSLLTSYDFGGEFFLNLFSSCLIF